MQYGPMAHSFGACASNVLKLHRRQSKILQQIVCALWYIRNDNPIIQEEILKFAIKYFGKLMIALARDLHQFDGHQRLKRNDIHIEPRSTAALILTTDVV